MDQDRLPYSRRKCSPPPRLAVSENRQTNKSPAVSSSEQMTNSWRALARMARDRIVQADPEDLTLVLNARTHPSSASLPTLTSPQLWSLRLCSLARLRLFNQVSAEVTNLFGALASIVPPTARTHVLEHVLPFELDVIQARVKYWAADAHGYTDALGILLRRCRRRARAARLDADRQMWVERGARVGLIAASQFIETKVFLSSPSHTYTHALIGEKNRTSRRRRRCSNRSSRRNTLAPSCAPRLVAYTYKRDSSTARKRISRLLLLRRTQTKAYLSRPRRSMLRSWRPRVGNGTWLLRSCASFSRRTIRIML